MSIPDARMRCKASTSRWSMASLLFRALDPTVRQTTNRQLIRIKRHINDPEFASAVVTAFRALNGRAGVRKRAAR
jgi:uncharacterized protein (UPF0261 family)